MTGFKHIPTERLEKMWEQRRNRIRTGEYYPKDLDELYSMRSELDRRSNAPKPSTDVDFESNYVTD